MTIIKCKALTEHKVTSWGHEATSGRGIAADIAQPDGDVTDTKTVVELARQVDRAGRRLIDDLGSLCETVLTRALGTLDTTSALKAALDVTLAEHGLAVPVEIQSAPVHAQALRDHLAATQDDATPDRIQVIVDPLLRDGEIVLVSLLGRFHAGPKARVAAMLRNVRSPA